MTIVGQYICALNRAAKAWRLGDKQWIAKTDAVAVQAEQAFDAAGKRSSDYPGVQAAERRYHSARAWYENGRGTLRV